MVEWIFFLISVTDSMWKYVHVLSVNIKLWMLQ